MFVLRKLYFKITSLSWVVLTILIVALTLLSTIILPIIEPKTFNTYMDFFWFTMTTMLTVGYGDLSPVSTLGRMYTILFLYVIRIGLFATFIGRAWKV